MSKNIWIFTIALSLGVSTGVVAHDGVSNATVAARMHAMASIGENMKTIGGMAQGKITFDAAAAQTAIDAIAAEAEMLPALFEAHESDPKSKASETIWSNLDDFSVKSAALKTAAEATNTSSAEELGKAMGGIGGSCKSCHKSYRIK